MKEKLLLFCFLITSSSVAFAQMFQPFAYDLNSPLGVEVSLDGTVWVIEGGTGNDDGQLWIFTPEGAGTVVVTGLPSYFNPESQELNSPLNVVLGADGTFYVVQGGGPSAFSGSIMRFDLEDYHTLGMPLTPSESRSIVHVSNWVLENGFVESNPYSVVIEENGDYIISDAAANALIKYTAAGDQLSVLATFSPGSNPLPFGPPFVDAVPTKIMSHTDGGYLVSTLTGFPFIEGAAKVYHVTAEGEVSIYQEGLTLVTDMAIDPQDGRLIVNEFARFGPMGFEFGSAHLNIVHDDHSIERIASNFGPSPGIGIAPNGNIYSSNLFLGQIQVMERCLARSKTISSAAGWTQKTICSTDGIADPFDVRLGDTEGSGQFIITDQQGLILGIQESNHFDLEGTGSGTCMITYISSDATITGLQVGQNIDQLAGCSALSNALTINRIDCTGCHTPINIQSRPKSSGGQTITWDRVKSAQSYTVQISYAGDTEAATTITARRNRIVVRASNHRDYSVSVRANCGRAGSSSYSDELPIINDATAAFNRTIEKSFSMEEGAPLQLDVFPNPAADFIQLQLPKEGSYDIILSDVAGRVQSTTKTSSGRSIHTIDTAAIAPGIYLVIVTSKDGIIGKQKLVIAR